MFRHIWFVLFGAAALGAAAPPAILHLRVPMRDSVHLDTNVFLPSAAGRYPAILLRTPYGKGSNVFPGYQAFIDRGYAVVMQDVRGRYASEGVFNPFDQEGADGYDTLEWIAREPWSNGKVGMAGGSYLGIAQWKVAPLNNPHLKAIFPVVSGDDDYLDRFYSPGGASKLGHRLLWLSENLLPPGARKPQFESYIYHLPLRTADRAAAARTLSLYQNALNHPTYDAFWKKMSVREKLDRVRVPVFAVGGWYDNYVESDLYAFSVLHKTDSPDEPRHRLMIGPWGHNMSIKMPGADFGPESAAPIRAFQTGWYDHWLKGMQDDTTRYLPTTWHRGKSDPDEAPLHIFVMGINRWRDEREWPLARTHYTSLYFSSKGHANTATGDGELVWRAEKRDTPDQFTYDPRNPVPTMGGAVCCNPKIFPWGPMDQRPVEKRRDVLVYTGAPLKRDLEITGPIQVVLYASSSAPDTDFTAKLVDVFPAGEARNLTDGVLRARYRRSLEKPEPLRPGEIYPLTIDAGVTSNVFLKGHRIRIEISSSNFPRFDRNPNTGRSVADETVLKKAQQAIHHGEQFPSHVLLPVVPEPSPLASARYGTERVHTPPHKPATN